jgi:hypothetical protein
VDGPIVLLLLSSSTFESTVATGYNESKQKVVATNRCIAPYFFRGQEISVDQRGE